MGKLFEDLGHLETAAQLYEGGLAHNLPEDTYWKTVRRLSFAHKRRGQEETQEKLWRLNSRGQAR